MAIQNISTISDVVDIQISQGMLQTWRIRDQRFMILSRKLLMERYRIRYRNRSAPKLYFGIVYYLTWATSTVFPAIACCPKCQRHKFEAYPSSQRHLLAPVRRTYLGDGLDRMNWAKQDEKLSNCNLASSSGSAFKAARFWGS